MAKKSKNTFSVQGNTIDIMRQGWDGIALATYREDYYKELTSHTWGIKNGYPNNDTLGGGLHRYMMAKWYGKDVLNDMTEKGYVVDHMNNNHMDCRICNLEFYKGNRNTAKGLYFDKETRQQNDLALSIFKDFSTGCYQITIGFNATAQMSNGELLSSIKLLYNCVYSLVVLDAERIITEYNDEHKISLNSLNFCDIRIEYAPKIELTEEEKSQLIIEKDGVYYLMLGTDKLYLDSVHYDEGWTPVSQE